MPSDRRQKMSATLTMSRKIGYSAASIGDAASYGLINSFFLFFLTTIAGVDPGIAGTIAAIGAVWSAVWSPIIGYISDNFKSKYGRRRPFIFAAAFPMAIAAAFAFNTIDASQPAKAIYYAATVLIFWSSFIAFFIPYLALGAEITDDYDERTELRSIAYIFSITGMVVGTALPTTIVNIFVSYGHTSADSWQMTAVIVGAISFASLMVTWKATRGRELTVHNNPTPDIDSTSADHREPARSSTGANEKAIKKNALITMFLEYWDVLKLKPLRFLLATSIFYLLGHSIHTSTRMYYFTFHMALSPVEISFMMIFITAIGAILMPSVLRLAKIYDKRAVLIVGFAVDIILITSMRFIGIDNIFLLCLFAVFYAIGNTCYWQLVPSVIYDVCELDELISGKRREGSVVSLLSLSEAFSTAISMQILGLILKFSGFDGAAAVQTETTLFWINNCFSIIPALFFAFSFIMINKYPIGKKEFNDILRLLETKRKEGKADLSSIKHMM